MLAVDLFIKEKINWRMDYGEYKMIGLLLTPDDVLTDMYGDCQGQAVTTASLLISMGFNAWVVETPFHWWTHAEDPRTGQAINLNVHGGAGNQGNVLPQPIDLVYTHPRPACTNCPAIFANNQNAILYAAPPPYAFMIAFTGAHIFVRSDFTLTGISYSQMGLMGVLLGALITLYGSYVQMDYDISRVLRRWVIASVIGAGPALIGAAFWATYLYPVCILHLLFVLGYTMAALSNDNL